SRSACAQRGTAPPRAAGARPGLIGWTSERMLTPLQNTSASPRRLHERARLAHSGRRAAGWSRHRS
ncbi:MAG: hypothetical protein ACK559_22555, partial [bacterium]